jgi:hypothetical protein
MVLLFPPPKHIPACRSEFLFFSGNDDNIDDDDVDVDDVVGGLRGGFRVLSCADMGREDPPWRAPVLVCTALLTVQPHAMGPRGVPPKLNNPVKLVGKRITLATNTSMPPQEGVTVKMCSSYYKKMRVRVGCHTIFN